MSALLYSPALDVIAYLNDIIFSPVLSGSCLLAVTYAPDAARNAIVAVASKLQLASVPPCFLDLDTAKVILQGFLALCLIRRANKCFNTMASNSWRMRASSGWDWPSEIAVVTGGSSGIGEGIVKGLVNLGVTVAVLDVQDMPKDMQADSHIKFYKCDITSSESVHQAADAVRRELGHPSILINNAGVAQTATILSTSESFLRRIFNVNCISLWFTTQEFLPRMIQLNKGHVVTVASIASFVALGSAADYSATKAGALAFHEALVCEIKHHYKAQHVLATVVHPNFVNTPLISDFEDRLKKANVRMLTVDQIADQVVGQIKSRRGGQLIIPKSASAISAIRGWPTWVQELLRDAIGKVA